MLDSERAAANSVSLVVILLVTRSQSQLVDKVESHSPLPNHHLLTLEVLPVVLTNLADLDLKYCNVTSR